MNLISFSVKKALFIDQDGADRRALWSERLGRFWKSYATAYLARQRKKLPERSMMFFLKDGECKIVKQWYYDHLPGCPDSAGYFAISIEGGEIVVKSFCEKDHPGPAAADCLYIDSMPLGRNETRKVPFGGSEIVIIDNADKDKTMGEWKMSVIKLLVSRYPDHPRWAKKGWN